MEKTGRRPRIHIPNTIYHVMARGNNRQNIFYNNDYFDYFLKILHDASKKFDHKILSFCLMTNHFHLIVNIKNSRLPSIMQNINFRYARWVNQKNNRVGHLFQGRYHAIEVSSEEYLINLCRYIHLNPVAANLVKDPLQYPWNSHIYYFSSTAPEWIDLSKIRQSIFQKTGLSYISFMKHDCDREIWKPALRLSENGKLMIDDEIIKGMAITQEEYEEKYLPFNTVMELVCNFLEEKPSEMLSSKRTHILSKKRALLMSCLLEYCEINVSQLAKYFQRSQPTVSRQIKRVRSDKEVFFEKKTLTDLKLILQEHLI